MRNIILDTNILINHWRRSKKKKPIGDCSTNDVEDWARKLIGLEQANAIVTPVFLEFVRGSMSDHELKLSRAFLESFRLLDE